MRHICLFVFLLINLACSHKKDQTKEYPIQNLETRYSDSIFNVIAFGSCNHEDDDQSYWNVINSFSPDIWIWMGDNIYGDTEDMSVMAAKYGMQKENEHYASFADSIKIYGTWDDHDYGVNDGNRTYPKKEESKKLLLEFLDVPIASKVYNRPGVFQSYVLGDEGRKVKLILLDTRTFQDPLRKNITGNPRYHKSEGDLLGEAQWQWLENALLDTTALTLIVSSIQFLPENQIYEKWANFPNSKRRMLVLTERFSHNNLIFLSGDRHISEISYLPQEINDLTEITSSGLTHSWEDCDEENNLRVSPLITQTSFGLLKMDWGQDSFRLKAQLISTTGEILYTHDLGEFPIR
ncbi:MAG: alkaline phosphatase family protein [Saprospiraceae bacterium]|nr:alkaline phosphatase family protein [Saprospiraceae bacterium]